MELVDFDSNKSIKILFGSSSYGCTGRFVEAPYLDIGRVVLQVWMWIKGSLARKWVENQRLAGCCLQTPNAREIRGCS